MKQKGKENMCIRKMGCAFLFLFVFVDEAKAQMVLSSPWIFGKRQVQGLSIPFLNWLGQNDSVKASVNIYRAPASIIKDGDGMVVSVPEGIFQCDGAPLAVAMMDGGLFEFPTDGACRNGILEVHSTKEQAQPLWKAIQNGILPSGVRQNSHYLVLQTTDQTGLAEFQRENETSVRLEKNPEDWEIFSSQWRFTSTQVKSGRFPTLVYEGLSEESRILIQIFKMPQSLSRQHGNIMIVMVPEREPFKCGGEKLRVTMTDGSFFDLSTTGKCVQNMVEAHSVSSQELDLWQKVQAGILPHAVGIGEKFYFKLLAEGDEGLKKFQQENLADG